MKPKDFVIPFRGLKDGDHQWEYTVDRRFFEEFDYQEFGESNVHTVIRMHKKPNLLEFDFSAQGEVEVPCDLTNEMYMQPVEGGFHLVVKFGEEFSEEDEELLIIPHGEHELDVSQFIYELIVLSVPSKRIHPGIVDGSLQSDILDKLEELAPGHEEGEEDSDAPTDPRWDDLKKLLKG